MNIDTDMNGIDKAIADALVCGTGVLKFNFIDGIIKCDHVPLKDFNQFGEELKWRSENIVHKEKNT